MNNDSGSHNHFISNYCRVVKSKPHCQHADGAVKVAEYIEIKTNVRGQTAETIRFLIDGDTLKQRCAEWDKLPFYAKLAPPPQPDLLAAMAVWYQTVKTGSTWGKNMTPGAIGDDTVDDVTSMKIGFALFHQRGK